MFNVIIWEGNRYKLVEGFWGLKIIDKFGEQKFKVEKLFSRYYVSIYDGEYVKEWKNISFFTLDSIFYVDDIISILKKWDKE